MGQIYSCAVGVIIWLGPDYDNDYANLIQHVENMNVPHEPDQVIRIMQDSCQLLNLPWFTRLWAAKELILANDDPVVLIGNRHTSWSMLVSAIFLHVEAFFDMEAQLQTVVDTQDQVMKTLYRIEAFQSLKRSGTSNTLWSRLRDTAYLKALDSRDKIYGMVAVTKFVGNPILPDYTLPIQTVLAQATAAMLQEYRTEFYRKFPLHYARDEDFRDLRIIPNQPSWVPDLVFQSGIITEIYTAEDQYWQPNALLRVTNDPSVAQWDIPRTLCATKLSEDYKTLIAVGKTLGCISWASKPDTLRGAAAGHSSRTLYNSSARHNGLTPRTFSEAVQQGKTGYADPSHLQASEDFEAFFGSPNSIIEKFLDNMQKRCGWARLQRQKPNTLREQTRVVSVSRTTQIRTVSELETSSLGFSVTTSLLYYAHLAMEGTK